MKAKPSRARCARVISVILVASLCTTPSRAQSQTPSDLRTFAVGRSVLERYVGADSVTAVEAAPFRVYATAAWLPEATQTARAAAATFPALQTALDVAWPTDQPLWIVIAPAGGALGREAPEWTAGIARPGERLIVLSGPALRSGRALLQATVAHELSHLLLHQRIGELGWVPRWFDEGLAVQLSGAVGWRDRLATFGRGPVRLAELTDVFPAEARAARFAYVESAVAARRLLERGSLQPLLDRVAAGEDFDVAFAQVYDQSLAEFGDAIESEVGRRTRIWVALGGGVTVGGVMALLAIAAILRTRHRNRRRARVWAAEEALQPVAGGAASAVSVGDPETAAGFDSQPGHRP